MGIGVIVRDFKGLVCAAFSQIREAYYPEPVITEFMGRYVQ